MKRSKNLQDKFMQRMSTRYGVWDKLNQHLFGLLLIGLLIGLFVPMGYGTLLLVIPLIMLYVRFFSKNKEKRYQENRAYQSFIRPLTYQLDKWRYRKVYKFVTCHSCQQKLRVPRNKGQLKVTCPTCHTIHNIKS